MNWKPNKPAAKPAAKRDIWQLESPAVISPDVATVEQTDGTQHEIRYTLDAIRQYTDRRWGTYTIPWRGSSGSCWVMREAIDLIGVVDDPWTMQAVMYELSELFRG